MKKLLFSVTAADCTWQYFTVGGHGGSGKDTSNSGARCVHKASGAVGEGREHRQLSLNRRTAFRRMAETPKFKAWHKLEVARRSGKDTRTIDEIVDEQIREVNLRIETGI